MENIELHLVIQHQIVGDGLAKILEDESNIPIRKREKYIEKLADLSPEAGHIILLDMDIPDMYISELLVEKNEQFPEVQVIVMGEKANPERIKNFINSGASGFLFKSNGAEELINTINRVSTGEQYLCKEVQRMLLDGVDPSLMEDNDDGNITDREQQILVLICKEMTNKEIAEQLNISVRTVDAHRRNILQKTGSRNTAGMVRYAIKHNIFQN